jgi:hypothetical protein
MTTIKVSDATEKACKRMAKEKDITRVKPVISLVGTAEERAARGNEVPQTGEEVKKAKPGRPPRRRSRARPRRRSRGRSPRRSRRRERACASRSPRRSRTPRRGRELAWLALDTETCAGSTGRAGAHRPSCEPVRRRAHVVCTAPRSGSRRCGPRAVGVWASRGFDMRPGGRGVPDRELFDATRRTASTCTMARESWRYRPGEMTQRKPRRGTTRCRQAPRRGPEQGYRGALGASSSATCPVAAGPAFAYAAADALYTHTAVPGPSPTPMSTARLGRLSSSSWPGDVRGAEAHELRAKYETEYQAAGGTVSLG